MPRWLRYALAAISFAVLALGVLVTLLIALQRGMWPLAPSQPDRWSAAPTSESILGCYEVSVGNWSPNLDIGADRVFITPPRSIELTSMPARFQGFLARPISGGSRWLPFGSWEMTPDHTLRLTGSNGHSGVTAELGPKGPALVGRAQSFWDFPQITHWATVTAMRVNCPTPLSRAISTGLVSQRLPGI